MYFLIFSSPIQDALSTLFSSPSFSRKYYYYFVEPINWKFSNIVTRELLQPLPGNRSLEYGKYLTPIPELDVLVPQSGSIPDYTQTFSSRVSNKSSIVFISYGRLYRRDVEPERRVFIPLFV